MRENLLKIASGFVGDNIFDFRKGDGSAYFVLYILIPVTITCVSLYAFPKDKVSGIYCYITILVSALNCIYDAANRWVPGEKRLKNTKLFFIMFSSSLVAAYCIVVAIVMFMTQNTTFRYDGVLLTYIVAIVVAIADIVACFVAEMAWRDCVDSAEMEEEIE